MRLDKIHIENFRMFGEGEHAFDLNLSRGLTALVGENDSGKTALIDALRCALGTRDQEAFRADLNDFHVPVDDAPRRNILIRCRFTDLTQDDIGTFAEYLSYEPDANSQQSSPVFYLNWSARDRGGDDRRALLVEVRSGREAEGPVLDATSRSLICATYLRPLRDAERALSAGRRSRLSQVLQHTPDVRAGLPFNGGGPNEPAQLSIVGIGDFADDLLGKHPGIQAAKSRLNTEFLSALSFKGDTLEGGITVGGLKQSDEVRLRQLLEKLELDLRDPSAATSANRGLGSNNLLFMACELLLLESESQSVPTLLIEEPEAHLHTQRQLLLIKFLRAVSDQVREDGQRIQMIVSTHSPMLASALPIESLVLMKDAKAYSLAQGQTGLAPGDYGFLSRFLDATKANLFFARGLLVVEGDAENLLLPGLARLIGRDLSQHGVSIVNVGHTGLRRYARILQRSNAETDGEINVPVACITDLDVMPDSAPEVLGIIDAGEPLPEKRRWKVHSDLGHDGLEVRKDSIRAKADGQNVKTFIANQWTLEYDLAYGVLAKDVWVAAHQACQDEEIAAGETTADAVAKTASEAFDVLAAGAPSSEVLACRVYALFYSKAASKPTSAQYLVRRLSDRIKAGEISEEELKNLLPSYLVEAIDYASGYAPGSQQVV